MCKGGVRIRDGERDRRKEEVGDSVVRVRNAMGVIAQETQKNLGTETERGVHWAAAAQPP